MSTLKLSETFAIDGTNINPTSVKLSNEAGTYGVKRNDTDAIVVVDDTSMVNESLGVFTYTFTQPAVGLIYTYWVEWIYDGNTFWDEHTVSGVIPTDLTPVRNMDKYVAWIRNEFKPLTLVTPLATIEQCVENGIRYWNTHSGYKTTTMVDITTSSVRVQLSTAIKSVVQVYPSVKAIWALNDHPLWTLLGVNVLDNVTNDLILLTESFKNYKVYIGSDFRWTFEKSDDLSIGGYLYVNHLPTNSTKLAVIGTKRITASEDITTEYILDWLLRYSKALVKQIEGNTLRKSSIINIKNDGQELITEGKTEVDELQESLAHEGRWVSFARRS